MKTFRLFLTMLFLFVFYIVRAQDNYTYPDSTLKLVDPIKAEKAKALVLDYIRILSKGDNPDSLVNICSIPFSWDRTRIIDNWADFKTAQQSVVAEKGGNRQFIIDTVFIKRARIEMLDKIIPLNVYYVIARIKIASDNREKAAGILFAVQISDHPKIIGFSD
jgi:hypothetical protein